MIKSHEDELESYK